MYCRHPCTKMPGANVQHQRIHSFQHSIARLCSSCLHGEDPSFAILQAAAGCARKNPPAPVRAHAEPGCLPAVMSWVPTHKSAAPLFTVKVYTAHLPGQPVTQPAAVAPHCKSCGHASVIASSLRSRSLGSTSDPQAAARAAAGCAELSGGVPAAAAAAGASSFAPPCMRCAIHSMPSSRPSPALAHVACSSTRTCALDDLSLYVVSECTCSSTAAW